MTKAGVHGPTGDSGDEADGGVHGRTVVAGDSGDEADGGVHGRTVVAGDSGDEARWWSTWPYCCGWRLWR